jgi:polysaccharide export outer membrane protein
VLKRQSRILAAGVLVGLLLAAASAAAQSASPAPNYVIGPNDRLRITVWNQNDISGEYTVERDGTFTFPLIGRVNATGLTVGTLEAALRALLADGLYKNPQVTAAIVEFRSKRVFLMGELRQPGTYSITGEITLTEALAKAGSTTATAAAHALIIRSSTAQGPLLPGQDASAEVTRIDLRQLNAGQMGSEVMVQDGDTVFVPRAASAYVYGNVRRPGSYPIEQDTTVLQALSLAGGVSEFGAANRVKILRVVNGKEQEIRVKLSDSVQPGDTVVVPERFF